jgi:hypothetical protein
LKTYGAKPNGFKRGIDKVEAIVADLALSKKVVDLILIKSNKSLQFLPQ